MAALPATTRFVPVNYSSNVLTIAWAARSR
jgi:hypothetical protein